MVSQPSRANFACCPSIEGDARVNEVSRGGLEIEVRGEHHAQERGQSLRLAVRVVVLHDVDHGDLVAGVRSVMARVDDPASRPLVERFQQLVFAPAQAEHLRQVVVRSEPIPKDERGRVSAVSKLERPPLEGDRDRHTALNTGIRKSVVGPVKLNLRWRRRGLSPCALLTAIVATRLAAGLRMALTRYCQGYFIAIKGVVEKIYCAIL